MPKMAVLSDIHSNLPALKVVLDKIDEEGSDLILCLGDIVGYGPNPMECIDLVKERRILTLMGNHDAGVVGQLSFKHFRNPNRKLLEITKRLLDQEQLNWLKKLPYIIDGEDWVASHSSPENPKDWTYIESAFKAREILSKQEKRLCFVGHTHRPALVSEKFGIVEYQKESKFLINPGSVGQSRDGDYRASFCILDTDKETYKNYRLDFDRKPVLTGLMKLGFSRAEATQLMKY